MKNSIPLILTYSLLTSIVWIMPELVIKSALSIYILAMLVASLAVLNRQE